MSDSDLKLAVPSEIFIIKGSKNSIPSEGIRSGNENSTVATHTSGINPVQLSYDDHQLREDELEYIDRIWNRMEERIAESAKRQTEITKRQMVALTENMVAFTKLVKMITALIKFEMEKESKEFDEKKKRKKRSKKKRKIVAVNDNSEDATEACTLENRTRKKRKI